jgi:uncharacterized protein (TIGR02246 family)
MRSLWPLAPIVVMIACSRSHPGPVPVSQRDDVPAIRAAYRGFVAADTSGDVERQLSYLTEDAVFMPPGVPTVHSKDALRRRWAARQRTEVLDEFRVDLDEVVVSGNWAYTRGTYVERSHARDGRTSFEERGRHLDILRRQPDGRWLIARHIRNAVETKTGSRN